MSDEIVGFGAAVVAAGLAACMLQAPLADADPQTPFTPEWVGTWHSGGVGGPARVHLYSVDPIAADIDIPGQCSAHWNESQWISPTNRLVFANVTSGPCIDNTWDVTILPTASLIGVDTAHPGTTFSFRPATSNDFPAG